MRWHFGLQIHFTKISPACQVQVDDILVFREKNFIGYGWIQMDTVVYFFTVSTFYYNFIAILRHL